METFWSFCALIIWVVCSRSAHSLIPLPPYVPPHVPPPSPRKASRIPIAGSEALIPRRVEGFSLETREVCVLDEALVSWQRRQSNAIERDLRFQGRDITGRYGLEGRVTHLWMCSVLNDPDALPARSDLIDNGVVDPEKLGTETCKDLEPEYRTKKLLRDRARAA